MINLTPLRSDCCSSKRRWRS